MADTRSRSAESDGIRKAAPMAKEPSRGVTAHDERDSISAIDAFAETDALQFAHLDREAAVASVDATWANDAVETAPGTKSDHNVKPRTPGAGRGDGTAVSPDGARVTAGAGTGTTHRTTNTTGDDQ